MHSILDIVIEKSIINFINTQGCEFSPKKLTDIFPEFSTHFPAKIYTKSLLATVAGHTLPPPCSTCMIGPWGPFPLISSSPAITSKTKIVSKGFGEESAFLQPWFESPIIRIPFASIFASLYRQKLFHASVFFNAQSQSSPSLYLMGCSPRDPPVTPSLLNTVFFWGWGL